MLVQWNLGRGEGLRTLNCYERKRTSRGFGFGLSHGQAWHQGLRRQGAPRGSLGTRGDGVEHREARAHAGQGTEGLPVTAK